MSLGALGNIFNLIRELNLDTLKQEAERPFTLLVTGEPELARRMAELLSAAPGKEGIHPWIRLAPLPTEQATYSGQALSLALVVAPQVDLSSREALALRRLNEAQVPVVVIVVNDAGQSLVGADLARQGEASRVLLPESLERTIVLQRLVPAIQKVAPANLRLALARQLPLLRAEVVHELIEEAARANGFYAVSTGLAEVVPVLNIPLNAADILVLTKNQLVMAYKIALATGKHGEPRDVIGEILGVLGGGFLFRQIARELVGLIPVVGIVPKVAVSYAGTWVIGRTIYLWASEGQNLNVTEIRRFYDEAMERGRVLAEQLVARVRSEREALPAPDGSLPAPKPRWWHRITRRKPAALPAPGASPAENEVAEGAKPAATLWQRLRRRLPF